MGNIDELLEELKSLPRTEALEEDNIMKALKVKDEFNRQKAIMVLEEKAREISQTRNFQRLLRICMSKLKNPTSSGSKKFKTRIEGIDLEYDTGEWVCDLQGVRRVVEKNGAFIEEVATWQPVVISNLFYNQELNTYRVQLAFKEHEFSPTRTITVNKSTIANTSNITALADYGISITNQSAPLLVKYLNDLERLNVDIIPRNSAISRVGWVGDKRFVPYNSDIMFDGETAYGELYNAIKPCGDYDEWKEMVLSEMNNIETKIVLGASFASPLVGLLDSLVFFVHLWGNTGNGKSVSLNLAQSVWGNPSKLVQNLNGTAVALERLAGFFCNLPLTLDELQTLKKFTLGREGSYDDILYKLGQGRGKSRGRKDGAIDRVQTWALSIITTGEEPITNETSGGGAKNRVLDVYCKEQIFNNATQVYRCSHKNYGWAGKEFINKLLDYVTAFGVSPLNELYDHFFNELMKTAPTEKQAMAATMVALGYTLMQQFIFNKSAEESKELGLALLKELRPMLISITDINNIENTVEDLIGFVEQNKFRFCFKKGAYDYNPIEHKLEVWGKITPTQINIANSVVQKFCIDKNISYRKFTKALIDRNLIEGRLINGANIEATKPVKINGSSIRCIVLKIENDEQLRLEEMPEDIELPF